MKKTILSCAVLVLLGSAVSAQEAIIGKWKRSNGTVLSFADSGGGNYCGTVMTGTYKGQSIGCFSGSGGKYKGKINKLDEGKTYKGKGEASGNTLKLSGCVLGGVICKSETLSRQ